MTEERFSPFTVEEALAFLIRSMDEHERQKLKEMPENDLILLHHGFGSWVRNVLNMWNNEPLLREITRLGGMRYSHPDDASMFLIEELWRRLQDDFQKNSLKD